MVLAAALAAVVAGGVAVVVLTVHDGGGGMEEPCRLPRVPAAGETASDATSAPDHGGLVVVEQGFTPITDDPLGPPAVTIGALVENTSGMVAYRTQVTFTMLDPSGAVVPDKEQAAVNSSRQVIPVIRPGERVGIGSVALTVDRDRPKDPAVPVGSVRVTLDSTHWVPPTSGGASFAPVTTRIQSSGRVFADGIGPLQQGIHADYIITSGYCQPIAGAHGALLWRDSTGKLIGGARAFPLTDFITCRPGQQTSWAVGNGVPKAADAAKTEVYPYCDPGEPRDAPDVP